MAMSPELQNRGSHRNFLVSRESKWGDSVWYFAGPPGNSNPRVSWDFVLCDGTRFIDEKWTPWRESAKRFLISLRDDPPPGYRPARESSLGYYFCYLRVLIRWMADEGDRGFKALDRNRAERFIEYVSCRPGRRGTVSNHIIIRYRVFLKKIYLQGKKFPEMNIEDPLPPGIPFENRQSHSIPHTPDEIAVPLLSAALRLIEAPASDVVDLYTRAQSAYDAAIQSGKAMETAAKVAIKEIADFSVTTIPGEGVPWWTSPITDTRTIARMKEHIYAACLLVVVYFSGTRMSEILGLKTGCIEKHLSADGHETFWYLAGRIYKTARTDGGDAHKWVVPPPVERAIRVMEELSRPCREHANRDELWLVYSSSGMLGKNARISVPIHKTIQKMVNHHFFDFINLPNYRGKRWHWSSHQGRKTFARFVGKRDRTSLFALAQHFGHVERAMTDSCYVGTDFDLKDLVDSAFSEEAEKVLAELLTATSLGGKAGRRIMKRSPFLGRTIDRSVDEFVRKYVAETGLVLVACEWGYCLYKQETSACHGDRHGPNPVLREETTCSACKNFAVTETHRPYWEEFRSENQALLEYREIGPRTRELAEMRLTECNRILDDLDRQPDNDHGT